MCVKACAQLLGFGYIQKNSIILSLLAIMFGY
jgi:hypothetical protein